MCIFMNAVYIQVMMALIAWVIRIAAIINQFNLSMKVACTFNLVVKAYSYTVIKKDLNTPDTVLSVRVPDSWRQR